MYTTLGQPLDKIDFRFSKRKGYKGDLYCENIICFDIETTTVFKIKGKWTCFDIEKVSKSDDLRKEYKSAEKLSWCYIWQLSIDDNLFYGRTLESFRDFISELNHFCNFKKIIYVHNLSFEFQFLQNVLRFDRVFARKERKPITATVNEFNIEFRCSYFLTRLSLEEWAESKELPVKKLVGNLDYNKLRTPLTVLSKDELDYCLYDVLVMYYGLLEFVKKYEFIWNIPLTQTGKVRRRCIEIMKPELKYRKLMASLVPDNLDYYNLLQEIFLGGKTGGSYIYAGRVVVNARCFDIASSYPYSQLVYQYPMTGFIDVDFDKKYFDETRYSFIIRFKCSRIKSRFYNTYWSFSKTQNCKDADIDNGRIMECLDFQAVMTNIDFEIFEKSYEMEGFEVLEFKAALNGYLNNTYRKYILDIYGEKTKLKDVDGKESLYHAYKEEVNSNYGMAVTKDICDDIVYDSGKWDKDNLDIDKFNDKTRKLKRNLSKRFTCYQHGVWIPAYSRRNLWSSVMALDDFTVYFDTDSNKNVSEDLTFFDKYNNEVIELSNKVADDLGVSRESFVPVDMFGKPHRIGIYAREKDCVEFKTLGAKKYCYRTADGELHQTVSGVRKGAVKALKNNIDNFDKTFVYTEKDSEKLLLCYEDKQEPSVVNVGEYDEYLVNYKFAIHCIPTTYELGFTPEYLALITSAENQDVFTEFIEDNIYE